MKTQFETEKEAKAALAPARCGSLGWCHVIKEDCKRKCVSYREGDIKQYSSKLDYPWYVLYPYCINPLVCGVITVEN